MLRNFYTKALTRLITDRVYATTERHSDSEEQHYIQILLTYYTSFYKFPMHFRSTGSSNTEEEEENTFRPWGIIKWSALSPVKSVTEITLHLGNTRYTNTLSANAIGVTLKKCKKQNPTQHRPTTWHGNNNKLCVILSCIMCSWPHAWLYPRGQDVEGNLGEPQKDFRGKHDHAKTPTPSRVEWHPTQGYVDYKPYHPWVMI